MCGRYAFLTPADIFDAVFNITADPPFPLRSNIAPTQSAPVIRTNPDSGRREALLMRWGLIPHWAKDPKIGQKMFNARVETAAEKPSFRTAWKSRRALIPASAFYEWKKEGTKKTPYSINLPNHQPFALAGLWSTWQPPEIPPPEDGKSEGGNPVKQNHDSGLFDDADEVSTAENKPENKIIQSFTILTTIPQGIIQKLHHRMPVILSPDQYDQWLAPRKLNDDEVPLLIANTLANQLTAHPTPEIFKQRTPP